MTAPILLTGGTGTLGRHVVPLLEAAGCDVHILTRRRREPAGGIEPAGPSPSPGDRRRASSASVRSPGRSRRRASAG